MAFLTLIDIRLIINFAMFRNFSVIVFFLLATVSCPVLAEKELKMAVTGLPGLEELKRNFGPFQDELNKASGLKIKLFPLSNRTVVVQSLKSKNVDLVLFGPSEYVIATSKTKIKPIAALTRDEYFSSIVVLSDSKIKHIKDLKGKKIGLGDFGSTAYYLSPLQMIKDAGIDPQNDIKAVNIAKQVGWLALKRKDIDALGLKYEQFQLFRSQDKDHGSEDFRVIARGPDLPNDILVAGDHVDGRIIERLRIVLKNNSDVLIKAILQGVGNKKYKGMKFITYVKDQDYDSVREMFNTVGVPEFSKKYS